MKIECVKDNGRNGFKYRRGDVINPPKMLAKEMLRSSYWKEYEEPEPEPKKKRGRPRKLEATSDFD